MTIAVDNILDLVFPKHCPCCGMVQKYQESAICTNCLKELDYIKQPACFRCGKAVENEMKEYCQDCLQNPKSFKQGFPVFTYTGNIKKALYDFKYDNQRTYAKFFAASIWNRYGESFIQIGFDGIVPIPVHRKKRKVRGYNQAGLIANELEKLIGVPVYEDYLHRVVNTNPQKELNDKARIKNLKNAFIIGTNKVKLNKVLLVDDIYTSGATIEACTQILMQNGVGDVYYTSVAIGQGY